MIDPQALRLFDPRADHLEEAPIHDAMGGVVGWQSTVISAAGDALGSGCHTDRAMARTVAVAETIERALHSRIKSDPQLAQQFQMDAYPSSCGFAVSLDSLDDALRRSVAEAVERWAWSKWIDDGCMIEEVPLVEGRLTPIAQHLSREFSKLLFFEKELKLAGVLDEPIPTKIQIVIALTQTGVFPGSRASGLTEDGWEHAVIEAWRHRRIFERLLQDEHPPRDLVNGRIFYFGNNKAPALERIAAARASTWTQPTIRLMRQLSVNLESKSEVHLTRALCGDYRGWHEGPEHRFVY